MKFFDVDKIKKNISVPNKYIITNAIAQRARQISERKGSRVIENGKIDDKFITQALDDLENDKVAISFNDPGKEVTDGASDEKPEEKL